jgi:hypothetical protein
MKFKASHMSDFVGHRHSRSPLAHLLLAANAMWSLRPRRASYSITYYQISVLKSSGCALREDRILELFFPIRVF